MADAEKTGETDTCTGQCGYSPLCRECEQEKKRKCLEAALRKQKSKGNHRLNPQP